MSYIENRRVELEATFNKLGEEKTGLEKQGAELNQRINLIVSELLRIQGAVKEIDLILAEEKKAEIIPPVS